MVKSKIDTTQEKILTAAKKVFHSKSMAGARMQDIADEAGINKALLHYYFSSKEKLFELIFKDAINQFMPRIIALLDSDLSLAEKIESFCREYIDLLMANPYLPLFVLNELNKQPERFAKRMFKNRKTPFDLFAAQIQKEVAARQIRPVHPGHLFLNMLSMCIFPFLARPLWMAATSMDDAAFQAFMAERKKTIPKLIMESLKK